MPAFLKIMPVVVLAVALMLPAEVRFNLAGQTIYAYRMAWLLYLPWVLFSVLRGGLTLRANDLLVICGSLWMVLSFVIIYGPGDGFASGIALALDVTAPYLIARLAIQNLQDFRRFLIVLAPMALFLALLLPVEGILQMRFIRDAATGVFGGLQASEFGTTFAPNTASDTRYGMLRAMGPFSHPILAGLFFCSLLPLFYFSRLRGWPRVAGVFAGFASVFTFSSAAMIGILIFLALAIYDWVRKIVVFLNWPIFLGALGALLLGLQLASQNGLISVLIRFTFNPQSGYYRLLIWEYGSASVARNPWFGIGFKGFEKLGWMGDSVDAFWLAVAVRNGLPATFLLGMATIWAIVGLAMNASRDRTDDQTTLIGLAITLSVLVVLGFTVSFFGGLLIWFALLLGVCTTLSNVTAPKLAPRPPSLQRYVPV
jgi:O-antigen ligase